MFLFCIEFWKYIGGDICIIICLKTINRIIYINRFPKYWAILWFPRIIIICLWWHFRNMLLKGSSILPLCIVLLVFLLKKIVRVLTELLKKSLIHKIYGEIIYKLNYIHKVNIVCVYIENIKYFLLVSAIFSFILIMVLFEKPCLKCCLSLVFSVM